jgi:acyl-coenzyme A synthetase/AMP-(fatty) acid ligase
VGDLFATVPPLTSEYVEVHAAHRPDAVAVVFDGVSYSYARVDQDIKRFTLAIRGLRMAPGCRVAISTGNLYLHWLLLLACENLGLATWTFLFGEEEIVLRVQLPFADMVISDAPVPEGAARRFFLLSPPWLAQVWASDPSRYASAGLPVRVGMDAPWRVRRSSGTTGMQKMLPASRRVEEVWLHGFAACVGLTQRSRYVARRHFTVGSIYSCATLALRLGATVLLDVQSTPLEIFRQFAPTHMRLFQPELVALLEQLPADWEKPRDFTLLVGAAPLTERVWQRTVARLTDQVVYNYNSNECGSICLMRPDGIGTIRPGVEVRIIDEAGNVCPAGVPGQITVRSPSAVGAYIGDPAASQKTFRDGWVHTGDQGVMVGPRQMRIVGRVDDLLNIGGLKLMPAEIEDPLKAGAPIADAGACSLPDENGIGRLHVGLVRKPGVSAEEAIEFVRTTVPSAFGRMQVVFFAALPRTETGKLKRALMREEIMRFLAARRS